MRFSVLAEFLGGFAVMIDFFFSFAVSNIPQYPPPNGKLANKSDTSERGDGQGAISSRVYSLANAALTCACSFYSVNPKITILLS